MKKIILLIVFGLQFHSYSNAQTYVPFPDSNALWSYVICYNVNPNPPPWIINCYTYYYTYNGDSLFNGDIYHKVFKYYDSTLTTPHFHCLIRQDTSQKKVYIVEGGWPNVKLLYDFSVSAGDTMNYIGCVVNSIDSILTNTGFRKRFHTNCYDIVEGIGSLFELFYNVAVEPTYNVSCFSQDGILIYQNPLYTTCNVFTSIDQKNGDPKKISIIPNPVSDCSHLIGDFSLSDNVVIEIYDYTSRKIVKSLKSTFMDFTLCKKDLNSGYYILKVTCNNRIYNLAFIVN